MPRLYVMVLRLLTAVILVTSIAIPLHVQETDAQSVTTFPIRTAVITNNANSDTSQDSTLCKSIERILKVNRIPYDLLDISAGQHPSFLDASSNPKYAAILIMPAGYLLDEANSASIVSAANAGIGVVGLLTDCVNTQLAPLFGITAPGTQWLNGNSINITQDKFTFSYAGETLQQPVMSLNHALGSGATVVATLDDSSNPAIWTYRYGAGKTVLHNHNGTSVQLYQGILLQSILYAMPVGVACPLSVGALEVDDCPRSYYTPEYLQEHHHNFISNFLRFLDAYNMTTSVFIAFSYSGDINDFWLAPESMAGVNAFLSAGHEVGIHCGSTHQPLDAAYWGSDAGVDAEVVTSVQTLQTLRANLASAYGSTLPAVISNVAPMNQIASRGYRAYDTLSDIKYIGTSYMPDTSEQETSNLPSSLIDLGLEYLRTRRSSESCIQRSVSKDIHSIFEIGDYIETYRDFGWEPGTQIYNLPRVQGDFYPFSQPASDDESYWIWSLFKCMVESGQPYTIFTHPDENMVLNYPNVSMEQVFQAYTIWASYAAERYPFYRWWTSSRLGDLMSTRSGALDANWLADSSTLQFNHTQPNEAIHIKTPLYLSGISRNDSILSITFSQTPTSYQSDEFDIVKSGQDYFIYPPGESTYLPVVPATPFQFVPWTGNQAPVLDPIGNKNGVVGQPLTFTISATDPNTGDTLTFSATNLPADAVVNPTTGEFAWTPLTTGTYPDITFTVSDGSLSDSETISIIITSSANQPPVLAPIGDKTVTVGQLLSFTLSATDPDTGDTLTYSGANLPSGISFNTQNGEFSWTPDIAGVYPNIIFTVSDGSLTDSEIITITITINPPPNQPPVLAQIGDRSVTVGQLLQFTLSATDPDSADTLTYSATNLPSGAILDSSSGEFSWTPSATGTYSDIIFAVSDGSLTDSETITITVDPLTNQPPVLDTIGDKRGVAGQPLTFTISAIDPDTGDTLTFSASGLPQGAAFDAPTATFSWTPDAAGTYPGVHFEVSDGTLTDSEDITITIDAPLNSPPVLDPIGNKTGVAGQLLTFTLTATDTENDTLTYSASNLPADAALNSTSGNFSWTPASAGTYPDIVFTVSDGTLTDSETISITIDPPPNHPPVLEPIGDKVTQVEQLLSFTISATDPDTGDTLTFSVSDLPQGAIFSPDTRTFSWTPSASGTYSNIIFTVNDGALTDSETITIIVNAPPNNPPILTSIGDKVGMVGQLLTFTISATDTENDPLTYSGTNLPDGATLNPTSGEFSWTPPAANTFSNIIFTVSDGNLTDSETISITVIVLPNNSPILDPIGDKAGRVVQLLTFTLTASDTDAGETLIFSASDLPQGATFDVPTATFSWTPDTAGTYPGVHFEVSDGEAIDSEDITITVEAPLNNPPVLNAIGNKSGTAGQLLTFTLSATDPDHDSLTYSATNLPTGSTLNPTSGVFSWTPSAAGTYPNITCTVSDSALSDSETISITINAAPSAPVTITKTITTSNDDGFSGAWAFSRTASWYEAGNPGSAYNSWLRFTGITIPQGATITQAHLELNQRKWTNGTKLIIKAENNANPLAPTSTSNHTSKARTTTGVNWTSGYADWAWHNSPDITSVIQELVNSYDYSNGAIQILIDNNGSTSNAECAGATYEGNAPPRLSITYQTGAPPSNQPPVLNSIGNKTVTAGQLLTFTLSAIDPDHDSLAYSGTNLPTGAALNPTSGVFSWTPASAGTYPNITFTVSDGSLSDSELISITVNAPPVNQPPVLNTIGNKSVVVGQLLQFTLSATDPNNGDTLTFSATNMPADATLNPSSGRFSWTPAVAGRYENIRFQVSDGILTDSETITITVSEAPLNNPPVLNAIGNKSGTAGQLLTFTLSATDPDHDSLTYSATNLPTGSTLNPTSGVFSWTPSAAGTYPNITCTVSDSALSDSETISITINAAPSAPVTITKTITTSNDDGFSGAWAFSRTASWYEAGNPGSAYNSWLRFTGITIPQGATITQAHLELNQRKWTNGTKLIIKAENNANPLAPTSTSNHTSKARTTTGVNWTSGYADWAWHNSPDITSVIQELVNSYDYSNGAIQILIDNNGSTSNAECAGATYEGNAPPRLSITYTVP